MTDLREFCDRLWNGEIDTVHEHHPVMASWNHRNAEEIDDGLLYYKGFASASTLDCRDALVMLDTGAQFDADRIHEQVRAWRPAARLAAAVFSHHHVDHI